MATLTIRNVPEALHDTLKERARKNRRSVNQEVIAELMEKHGTAADERTKRMLALARELREEGQISLSAQEIREAIDEGRR